MVSAAVIHHGLWPILRIHRFVLLPKVSGIYATRFASGGPADRIEATAQRLKGFSASRTVLLLGPETASAAEVFARALIAAGAVGIGLPTAGKCVGQEVIPLAGDWILLLSTVRILDSEGLYCDGKGYGPSIPWMRSGTARTIPIGC